MFLPIKPHVIMLITLWFFLPATSCLAMDHHYAELEEYPAAQVHHRASPATDPRNVFLTEFNEQGTRDTRHRGRDEQRALMDANYDEPSILNAMRTGGNYKELLQGTIVRAYLKYYSHSPSSHYNPNHSYYADAKMEQYLYLKRLQPIMLAARAGFAQCLQELLRNPHFINDNAHNVYGRFHCAHVYFPYGHSELSGWDANKIIKSQEARYDGATALFFAAGNPNPECVKVILSKLSTRCARFGDSAFTNALNYPVNYCGTTPLMHAVENNRPECVILLIEAGADLNLQNKKRETALSLAAKHNYQDCLQILVNAGAKLKPKGAVNPFKAAKKHEDGMCLHILNEARAHDKVQNSLNPGSKSCSVS